MPRIDRFRRRLDAEFPAVLAGWLAKLPAGGFVGTTGELWDALAAGADRFAPLPRPNALLAELDRLAPVLTAAGFALRRERTARARLVRIVPVGTPRQIA